ncbi:hypothetical protein [Aliiroseovarius sediminis]|uniref:hypothetical protein n=1 Tax=Aliiroseovarius sediminis TaxID=2925839 RepID=UPI001F5A22B3|nr:hypothetical protein [Aliiroseovarius sediminis]MCI2395597.1 hypothetical protein [Aliiroseovarius sediminis]
MKPYADKNEKILAVLDSALIHSKAEFDVNPEITPTFGLSDPLREALDSINDHGDNAASTALTNIVTALAIKSAYPDIDSRYHMVRIQKPVSHFSHRPVSENIIYPWLSKNKFDGAKSGWQTRVFERPKPYKPDYDEAIGAVKQEFLYCYKAIEEDGELASEALKYLVFGQIIRREAKRINLVVPKISDIATIIKHFENHFHSTYKSKGASRLPVLALHSLYRLIMPELKRFDGFDLADLELHSAADAQTGATGDIEIKNDDGSVFEALEVKHLQIVTSNMVDIASQKLIDRSVDRYYILTTHASCVPGDDILTQAKEVQESTGCQIIVNGVLPTLRYYLRLVSDPSAIFPHYVELLKSDTDIGFEHRERWNQIILGT